MVSTSIILIIAIGGGSILFGLLFGSWIYRSIGRPLNDLIVLSDTVAKGDLRVEHRSDRKDEIGSVQRSMGSMVTSIRGITGRIKGATDSVASNSEELSATADTAGRGLKRPDCPDRAGCHRHNRDVPNN